MKKLRIKQCSDPQMWYANLINQVVPFIRAVDESYLLSREPAGYLNIVRREDAQEIEVINEL